LPDGRRLLHAIALLVEVDARLRLNGFARLQELLSPPAGTAKEPEGLLEEARCMARAFRRASCFVPRARCLHRALALLLWLRRRGGVADLRIGVRSPGGILEGHAWVEWHGTPLDEEPSVSDRFRPLEQIQRS
jgi:hypothetical protein